MRGGCGAPTRVDVRPCRFMLRGAVVGCTCMFSIFGSVTGQEMPAPIDRQMTLLTKVLEFDRQRVRVTRYLSDLGWLICHRCQPCCQR